MEEVLYVYGLASLIVVSLALAAACLGYRWGMGVYTEEAKKHHCQEIFSDADWTAVDMELPPVSATRQQKRTTGEAKSSQEVIGADIELPPVSQRSRRDREQKSRAARQRTPRWAEEIDLSFGPEQDGGTGAVRQSAGDAEPEQEGGDLLEDVTIAFPKTVVRRQEKQTSGEKSGGGLEDIRLPDRSE